MTTNHWGMTRTNKITFRSKHRLVGGGAVKGMMEAEGE